MNLPDFQSWLSTAKVGEALVYYRGDLAYDRECQNKTPVPRHGHHGPAGRCGSCDRCVLDKYAQMILINGVGFMPNVRLVQNKRGINDYSYIAVKAASC